MSTAPRYGLTNIANVRERQACLSSIQLDVQALQQWSTNLFQADRPTHMKQQSTATWKSTQQRVYEYLGYLYHEESISRPGLRHYTDSTLFSNFTTFLMARGVDKPTVTKAVYAATRVVSWLATQPQSSAAANQCQEQLAWLQSLHTQLCSNLIPKPKAREPEQLREQGKWMDAPHLLSRVEAVRLSALEAVHNHLAGSGTTKLEAAAAINSALLACLCFGYIPPMRDNSILTTLTTPEQDGCLHQDCQQLAAGCQGNRVFRDTTTGVWQLHAPHHKNTRRWQGVAIKLQLPQEVGVLLDHHLSWGLQTLTRCTEAPPYLLANPSTGKPLKPQEVSTLWKSTVLEGTGISFGPQLCRSIFVVGTRDMQMADMLGPGAAMAMGNSEDVWDSVYDRHFNTRQVGEALAAMPAWRQQMLAAAAGL